MPHKVIMLKLMRQKSLAHLEVVETLGSVYCAGAPQSTAWLSKLCPALADQRYRILSADQYLSELLMEGAEPKVARDLTFPRSSSWIEPGSKARQEGGQSI